MAAAPAGPEVTLGRSGVRGVPVDAALLVDADLECLPDLLAGEPLAESAVLIRGRDRHLLTEPGGLLEELPVGEPLHCLGPGNLYLPLGYRLRPALPAPARARLFPTDSTTAIVLLPEAALRFDLSAANRQPVWTLWAGPPPAIDDQLPPEAVAELQALDAQPTGADPVGGAPSKLGEFRGPVGSDGSAQSPASGGRKAGPRSDGAPAAAQSPARTWRDEAYQAELAGELVRAAELHMQHNDPLRAARLYERAAERA